ncbi:unnamed protein product [Bursaphelenchus xylophilus]|uniref:RNA helicase n=1 Tax=Bursaphelenchus xylophilus TaxID=6326 RepID=A0A7I8WJK4_BURXY|nr:unnamed protein product [Bursaphelenchus xylophilus]CAG9108113.1 unnamed protein product [Bursaphelenchus xylophilus]
MSYSNVPPPKSLLGRTQGYTSYDRDQDEDTQKYDSLCKKGRKSDSAHPRDDQSDEEYFNDDEDERKPRTSKKKDESNEEEEVDELELFMAEIEQQAKKDVEKSKEKESSGNIAGGGTGREDIDAEDMQESYFKFLEDYKERHPEEDEDNFEYDEDGNVIWTWKKVIDPLPSCDHSKFQYPEFKACFYKEHEDISKLTPVQVFELRNSLDIKVYGADPPKPCVSFAHFNLDDKLMSRLRKSEFSKPTSIQAQAIPTALSGRDVLGLAKTGSGKTLAYVIPAVVHVVSQSYHGCSSRGPIAVVIVPTRELALQVYEEFRFYARPYELSIVCAHGGGNKYEQGKALKTGCDICIATPGRMIDFVKSESTDLIRTSFLVFDEADRMFDMGFEAQVKSIADHVRPDRQCLMFSATFPSKIEKLTSYALSHPVKIVCGDVGEANADVMQHVLFLPSVEQKWQWLCLNIIKFCADGKVIVFVTKKLNAEIVAEKLKQNNVDLVLLHGDMLQAERSERLKTFRSSVPCLVATDVAARGLDIPEVKTVVNFDIARDINTHVHRIGRTGRAGQKGDAFTLMTSEDKEFAGPLIQNLENAGQEAPPELIELAKTSKWYIENGSGQQQGKTRVGLGFTGSSKHRDVPSDFTKPKDNVTHQIEKAKNVASSSTGLGLTRLATMRHYLSSSYKGSFTRASTDESPTISYTDPTPSRLQPNPTGPAKKKSRCFDNSFQSRFPKEDALQQLHNCWGT